jgi:hypothetical protein
MSPAWFAIPTRQDYDRQFGETGISHYLREAPITSSTRPSALPDIPWDKLWEDDQYWFPLLLANKRFAGRVDFEKDFGDIRRWWFGTQS